VVQGSAFTLGLVVALAGASRAFAREAFEAPPAAGAPATVPTIHEAAASDAIPDRHHITIPTIDLSGETDRADLKRHSARMRADPGRSLGNCPLH